MKNLFKTIIGIVGLSVSLAGCTGDFGDMNTDPNNPTPGGVDPKFQLAFIQARGIPYANQWQQIDQLMISTLCEYGANDQLSPSDYNIDPRYVASLWDISYTVVTNANSLINANAEGTIYGNVVQMARIWKAYVALRLTNCIGDIPYSEAAAAIDQPKYDTQKDIYYTIFEELADAVSKLDETAENTVGNYDLIYAGDVAKWKKLANSMRLRMAVRISDVDPDKAKTEAAAAVQAGVFESDADAAYLLQGDESLGIYSINPIYYHAKASVMHMSTAYKRLVMGIGGQPWPTAADQALNSNITDEILAAKNAPAMVDPRAPIQFEPAGVIETPQDPAMLGNWDGTDPGHITAAVGAAMDNGQFTSNMSKIGPWYYATANRSYPLFKYSELCFLKAIAIETGLTTGDAKAAYEAGVRSSMTELGVPESVISDYLASDEPNYYGTTANYDDESGDCNTHMDKILTQKYIAQFQECSFETWADHRQFHKPTLMPFASVNSGYFTMDPAAQANNTPDAYAKRLFYPSSEYTVNEANVREAEERMGGSNSIQNNVWWDVD